MYLEQKMQTCEKDNIENEPMDSVHSKDERFNISVH